MKIKEIRASKSGVIPLASYTNLRPGYEAVADLEKGDDPDKCFAELQEILDARFFIEENKALVKLIEKQFQNVGFHKNEEDNLDYPRTSSIMDWDSEWKIAKHELSQYGARGTIVHKLCHLFVTENEWFNPIELAELDDEVNILLSGNLKLGWKECSHKKFMEKYRSDVGEVEAMEKVVFNKELFYSGTPDLVAPFKGLKSIIDYKTGAYDFASLAAYAGCIKGIKQLVIFPVGESKTVSGYSKPIIRSEWSADWDRFVEKRRKFRENFGI